MILFRPFQWASKSKVFVLKHFFAEKVLSLFLFDYLIEIKTSYYIYETV